MLEQLFAHKNPLPKMEPLVRNATRDQQIAHMKLPKNG